MYFYTKNKKSALSIFLNKHKKLYRISSLFFLFFFKNQPQALWSADVDGRNQLDKAVDRLTSFFYLHILSQHNAVK